MDKQYIYQLKLTEKQARILSYACNEFSRLICGQDWSFQNLMEEAWEKRAKKATGNSMDKEFEGGWHDMRADAEEICKQIKKRFWGLDRNTLNGVYYNDEADILFDLHQVIRHQIWLDTPEDKKSKYTVDADSGIQFGSEPMAKIKRL